MLSISLYPINAYTVTYDEHAFAIKYLLKANTF